MDPTRATALTSVEAYSELQPTLAERQRAVCHALERLRQLRDTDPTSGELLHFMREQGYAVRDVNDVRPRLTELRDDRCLVFNPGKRRCGVSGKRALTWRIFTGGLF
jgi:hypothetical protein